MMLVVSFLVRLLRSGFVFMLRNDGFVSVVVVALLVHTYVCCREIGKGTDT